MTSFVPLAERVLSALRNAAPGSYAARTAAERHDLEVARRMSIAERLEHLDEILRFTEPLHPAEAPMKRIEHGVLLI
jgi:hypothetical protein